MDQYSWVSVFKAVSNELLEYEDKQEQLVSWLRECQINGLDDQNPKGSKFPLREIDPFSFFASVMKNGDDTRHEVFKVILDHMRLDITSPSRFEGVPSAFKMSAWLFPYSYNREPHHIPTLWKLFKQAHENAIDSTTFSDALDIPKVGFTKLTQSLFYCFPDKFLPIDGQTKPFLEKHGVTIPSETWESYQGCLAAVKEKFTQPFCELSHRAWYENNNSIPDSKEVLEIKLTDGAIRNGYIRIPAEQNLFPEDCCADNEGSSTNNFELHLPDGRKESTCVLLNRGRLRLRFNALFKQHNVVEGDIARITEIEPGTYQLHIDKPYTRNGLSTALQVKESNVNVSDPITPLNTILFGPPGTGKTRATVIKAIEILSPSLLQKHDPESKEGYAELKREFDRLRDDERRIEFVTFHQSFSYEDFVEGIRATPNETEDGGLPSFDVEKGIFREISERAMGDQRGVEGGYNADGKVWKISINGASPSPERKSCFEKGEARIGWDHCGDLSNPSDITSEQKTKFDALGKNDKSTILYFEQHVSEGDLLVCISSNTNICGVGVVADSSATFEHSYPHYKRVRKVNWLAHGFDLSLKELNGNKQFPLKTVSPLDRISPVELIDYIARHDIPIKGANAEKEMKPYLLIIDEINRGNISRIFGELITLLEPSKRAGKGCEETHAVKLPYSKKPFTVPNNLYVIGTMNTADRSLMALDTALRRRFTFEEMLPQPLLFENLKVEGIDVAKVLTTMNSRIEVLHDRDHVLGHGYFLPLRDEPTLARLALIFEKQIIPLLQEYFFDDWERIRWVLNDHRKESSLAFIQSRFNGNAEVEFEELFGDEVAQSLGDMPCWELNKGALNNPISYRKIYMN